MIGKYFSHRLVLLTNDLLSYADKDALSSINYLVLINIILIVLIVVACLGILVSIRLLVYLVFRFLS